MSVALTGRMRSAARFVRTVTGIVLVAFLSFILQPLAVAANAPSTTAPAPRPAPASNDEDLAKTLVDIEDRLDKLVTRLGKKQDAAKEKSELKALRQNLAGLDRQALADFDKIGKRLKDKNLPNVILDRHTQAVKTYQTEMATLNANLAVIDQEVDDIKKGSKAKKAKDHLMAKRKKSARPPADPNNLPTRALKPNRANKPRLNKEEFRTAGLYDHPTVKLAALGDFTFDKLPGANDPAYLAATPEVVLSDAIKAKAAELEYNPVKIYNWIYANTEWLPTWGAIQNSDTALLSQKGNAFDLASLLIALLRASGFPARYVHGTIDIPADKFMNWAGGFTDPNGAWDLASAAGVPITAVTGGGKITAFRLEHIWVEAALDFYPSGGAINKSADAWVTLDPSFKQYVAEPAYDMHARLNFDGEQFMMDYIRNGADKTPYQHYSKKVLDHLKANMPDWTLEGLYGHERVSPLKTTTGGDLRELAASLPYKIFVRGYTAGAIPDALRHKVTVEIANNPVYGSDASYTVALADLGTQRLTLSYIPESAADDAVVNDYGSLFASPAYLVRVKPVLRKAGATVATGAGTTLGEKQTLTLSFQTPTLATAPIANQITAGSYSAIVFRGTESTRDTPSTTMQTLAHNAELNETNQAQFDDLLGQLLHAIGVQWFFNLVYERDFYATTTQMAYTRLPSEAIATADLSVSYWFGIPRTASPGPFTVDADADVLAVASVAGATARRKDFMLLAGTTGSAWEHLVLEGFFSTTAVSSMKLLRTAADQGIPIHRINSGNIAQILPLLTLAPEDLADIQNGIAVGKEAIVSQSEVQVGDYRGVGLLILDPQKGDGFYLISGGLAGGGTAGKTSAEYWKNDVYNSKFSSLLAREFILRFAWTKIGTPYGFGCKDPFFGRKYEVCTAKYTDYSSRIDCSGLVAFAYGMVGFPFFHDRTANMQYEFIGANPSFGSYPSATNVKLADLKFWEGTQIDKNGEIVPGATHVGIYLGPGQWIAAQGNDKTGEVNIYSDTPYWTKRFMGYGSVLK
jgi:hypothetical protein